MFSWTFASRKEHSASWYLIAIIVVLMLVVYGIIEWLYLMSVVAFLFAGVYLLMENNSTPITQVYMTERGIQVAESFYEYSAFARFAIISIANVPAFIRLYPSRKLAAIIDIPLSHEVDIAPIRDYLATVMQEEKNNSATHADTLIHAMRL